MCIHGLINSVNTGMGNPESILYLRYFNNWIIRFIFNIPVNRIIFFNIYSRRIAAI